MNFSKKILSVLCLTLSVSTVTHATSLTLQCEGGILLTGVGSDAITISSADGKGLIWPSALVKSDKNTESDCLRADKYLCYSVDDQAMVNIPIKLAEGKINAGSIYLTTDLSDEALGERYKCSASDKAE